MINSKIIRRMLYFVLLLFVFCENSLADIPYSMNQQEIVFAAFEGEDYGQWTVTGTAFGTGPAKGTLPSQQKVSGYRGKGLVNTYLEGDKSTGSLTSPVFKINHRYIRFLIGGGDRPNTCLQLLVDNNVVRSHSGANSEHLDLAFFDVTEFQDKTAVLRILDDSSEGWGHISVDSIILTNEPPKIPRLQEKAFTVSKKYLILPIQNKGRKSNLKLSIDGNIILDYSVAIAESPEKADWYAFFSIERFSGKQARLVVIATEEGFPLVKQSDLIPGQDTFYKEKLRPLFHFTSKTGWLNDPNGLIYYKGVYHLFYQHNPVALPWGNMTWGHATSPDMIHWTEQPKVLFPDVEMGACYSGAAFIDWKNQLGKKTGPEDVIVLFYLRTKIGLCLAYSNDGGYTFTDYEGNPVLTHAGARIDTPRPFWFEATQRWVAPTYDFFTNEDGKRLRCVGFYSSPDLINWKFESRVEQDKWGDELCGCVDFFQLSIDGDPNNKKWVMIFIEGSYIVGDFDGSTFYTLARKPASTQDRICSLVTKGSYYATMTWENAPDNRRVQITWMGGSVFPDMPFSQQMTVPSELTLHSTEEGLRLRMNPIEELKALRTKSLKLNDVVLKQGINPLSDIKGEAFDIEVEFHPAAGAKTIFGLRGVNVTYDSDSQKLICGKDDRSTETLLKPVNGVIRLRILLDRGSIEVYGNDGRVYLPLSVIQDSDDLSLSVTCDKGLTIINALHIHEMKSLWE